MPVSCAITELKHNSRGSPSSNMAKYTSHPSKKVICTSSRRRHEVKGAVEAAMQDNAQQHSLVRPEGLQILKIHEKRLKDCKIVSRIMCGVGGAETVQAQWRIEDDRIPTKTRAGMIRAPCEPSEIEKPKHDLTHIPFQPWGKSCVKSKSTG